MTQNKCHLSLFMSNGGNSIFQIWQQDGTFVTEYAQNGIFDFPYGISTTTQHHIVVTDLCQHCVTILNPNGSLRNKFGCYGDKLHNFDHPYFLTVTQQDHVIVSDTGNTCIKSFTIDGAILQYFNMDDFRLLDESFILLQGITVDTEGHILVVGNSCFVFGNEKHLLRRLNHYGAIHFFHTTTIIAMLK